MNDDRQGQGLELHGITVHFGGLVAVDGLSLQAPAGALTGLIGPNGAGKSTTFNVCSGFVRATAGRVELFGRDIT
ncbi:MAG: ATP-binding cassette domain-containing protein, partial [Mycobacteriales bacterium]